MWKRHLIKNVLSYWSNPSISHRTLFPPSPVRSEKMDPVQRPVYLCLDLCCSCFARTSRTIRDPFLPMIARSEVGSLTGSTGSTCVVKTSRPSKNGGFESWTRRINLFYLIHTHTQRQKHDLEYVRIPESSLKAIVSTWSLHRCQNRCQLPLHERLQTETICSPPIYYCPCALVTAFWSGIET